jgi:hypothetical protein
MTLADPLLARLADWRPTGPGRHAWSSDFPDQGWQVRLTADRVDTVGSLLWDVSLSRLNPSAVDESLKAAADRIAGRVTGLLEPLRLDEVDDPRGIARLRSQQPARRGEQASYYEVLLTGLDQVSVRRYQSAAGGKREQIAFALTHEALAKLVGDLTA